MFNRIEAMNEAAARISRFFACLFAALAALCSVSVALAAEDAGLVFVSETEVSPRLREVTLQTPVLIAPDMPFRPNPTGETQLRVLLPEDYDQDPTRRYPVLYLLHGGGEDFRAWTTRGDAEALTAGLPLIVVMPDCGGIGGYANWYNEGAFGTPQWRTYHLDQLAPWIDAQYRTIPNRAARAVAGLSMGGNGAVSYSGHRPDLFGAAASFSGSVDLTQVTALQAGPGAHIGRLTWGAFPEHPLRWRADSGPDMARNYANTDLSIYTGDAGDPESTFILGGSATFHQRLDELDIAHRYILYSGMQHVWATWDRSLADWLPHLMMTFEGADASTPAPASFSYSTIDAEYRMYDWSVALQRPAVEYSALEVDGPRHFRLIGSGAATVRTPAAYALPGARIRAVITRAGERSRTLRLVADSEGRLTIPLQLGPGNRFEQYSPEADAAATGPATDQTPFRLANNGSRFFQADVELAAPAQ